MMLDDLQAVIEQLQNMIKTHDDDYLSGKETRTRQVLIDPLLQQLGWEVSDPDAVKLEYGIDKKRADYALMSDGKPIAVIEAKGLNKPLTDTVTTQVHSYVNEEGIPYMIVTDGNIWEMYEVFKKAALKERLLMEFQLSKQPAHEIALQVLRIWKPNLASGNPKKAMKSVLDADADNDDGIGKKKPTDDDGKTFKEIDGDWTNKEICAFRFEGKTYKEVKDWADFFVRFFEILSKDDPLQFRDVLELKPFNFKDNPSSFPRSAKSIKEIGKTGVYVHTGISSKDKQKVIKDVVTRFRCDMPVPLEEAG